MKTVLSIALCFFVVSASAQAPVWDSSYRPGNFALKVEQFRSYPNSKKDIIFLGNSITAGTDWVELLQLPAAKNRGISGDITFGVLERLSEVTEGKPAMVFILIGINDISRNIPDSIIIRNYRTIIRRIQSESPSTKIYFQTLLPVNNEYTAFKNHYNKDEHILAVNKAIRSFAGEKNVTVVDLHPHFLNADGKLDKMLCIDGLHLNPSGYKVWASVLQKGKYFSK